KQVLRAYIFCGACGNNRTNRGGFQFAAARLPWFRGIMLNVFRSRYCWTMWLGALITSLLFVAAHSQYQNLLTLAELFLVGLITSVARIRSGGLLLPVLLHMEATTLGLLFG
ncbi:CPBP family intramembrane glutamic endopeptidase, partial [Escherichia coli]|uniref:CPBP family intramembrane glutamic endopeptidase n=1 Tax=Escherichia coli TaxID=562 RepID=UPI0020364FEF